MPLLDVHVNQDWWVMQVEVKGLDQLMAAFRKFPKQVARNMSTAAREAANDVILPTRGLQRYPKLTDANRPPTPYYLRGTGMVYKNHTKMTSENLGKQWNVKREGYLARIGNRASYAKWVHGEEQAKAMGEKGWRKLLDVAKEKIVPVTKIYNRWVAKTLKDLGV